MRQWKRLLFYLVLNVLVSACTVLAVLIAWDQMRGPLPRNLLPGVSKLLSAPAPTPTLAPGETPVARPTPTESFITYQVQPGDTFESIATQHNISVEELVAINGFTQSQPLGAGEVLQIPEHPRGSVIIDSVIGPGDLASERVLLKHRGEGELSLVGWQLDDGKGNVFVFPQFPQLILYRGGAVSIYTKAGNDTVVELYWGLKQPVWSAGATVTLRDTAGQARATYVVP